MVFADTAYFLALLIPGDSYHRRAVELSQASFLSVITSEYVLLTADHHFEQAGFNVLLKDV